MPSFFSSLVRRTSNSNRVDGSHENRHLPPPYAIDFAAAGSEGERIAKKTHVVKWRFGFPPSSPDDAPSSAADGTTTMISTAAAHRDDHEEHEVELVWDWNARRRFVYADGKEVDREISRSALCNSSWTMGCGRKVRVVAHAFAKNDRPDFRQYDLLVDGRSFFSFPKRERRLPCNGPGMTAPDSSSTSSSHTAVNEDAIAVSQNDVVIEAPRRLDEDLLGMSTLMLS